MQELDLDWPEPQKRALIKRAVDLYRIRGTKRGLALLLRLFTGHEYQVSRCGPGSPGSGGPGRSAVTRTPAPTPSNPPERTSGWRCSTTTPTPGKRP